MMNGMNINKLMKQAKKMQKQMGDDQAELNKKEFTGVAPDEMVKVVLTGDHKMKDIQIKPEAIDPDDPDMLGDLILAAFNQATDQINRATQSSLGKYGMPGM